MALPRTKHFLDDIFAAAHPAFLLMAAAFTAAATALVLRPTEPSWWLVRLPGVLALVLTTAAVTVPPSPTRPRLHRWLGWIALAALAAHVSLVASLHQKLWDWLNAAIPPEIGFGIAAAAGLTATLIAQRPRRLRNRSGPAAALRLHRQAGHVALAAAAAHIGLVAGAPAHLVGFAALGLIALLAGIAFTGRDRVAIGIVLALVVAGGAIAYLPHVAEARLETVRRAPIDSAGFHHANHATVQCVTCHHNFLDGSGMQNCLTCHKALSRSEALRIGRLFHDFCGECHRTERAAGLKSGPADACSGCHAG